MIEAIDQRLTDWIRSVFSEEIEVSLRPPGQMGDQKAIGLYLKDILPSSPAHGARRPPLQVLLRYLVTTQAQSPEEAHHILGRLLFAAMEHPEYEVSLEPISAQVWTAFETIPRPAFMLSLPLRVERPVESTKLIRSPIEVTQSPLISMAGTVMGPEEMPLANVRVELTSHNLAARTDVKGRFVFPSVPALPAVKKARIIARGREMLQEVDTGHLKQKPLIIHFDVLEV